MAQETGTDVFNRTSMLGGAMSADATKLTFAELYPDTDTKSGGGQSGLILQEVGVNYSQQITRLYALESGKLYFVAGRTEGGITAKHVVGPSGIQQAFYDKYGNVCNAKDNSFLLSFATGCGDTSTNSGTRSVYLASPVISKIGISLSAQDFIVFSDFEGTFATLKLQN